MGHIRMQPPIGLGLTAVTPSYWLLSDGRAFHWQVADGLFFEQVEWEQADFFFSFDGLPCLTKSGGTEGAGPQRGDVSHACWRNTSIFYHDTKKYSRFPFLFLSSSFSSL